MIKQNKHVCIKDTLLSTKASHSKNSAASDTFGFRGQQ